MKSVRLGAAIPTCPAGTRVFALVSLMNLAACAGAPSAAQPSEVARPSGVWRPFEADSPWNTPIAADAPVHPDSESLVRHLMASKAGEGFYMNLREYSVPVYWVDDAPQRAMQVILSNRGEHRIFVAPWNTQMRAAGGTDKHLAIVDRDAGRGWDFWLYDAPRASVAAYSELRGSGVRPLGPLEPPRDPSAQWWQSHGARACGYPLIAGLIYPEEFEAAAIEHALALGYPGIRPDAYVPPASTAQANFERVDPGRGVPCGGRIQLDPDLDLERLGLTGHALTLARALQRYGAYIADFSGGITLYGDASDEALSRFESLGVSSELLHERVELLEHLRVLDWGTPYPGALNRRPE